MIACRVREKDWPYATHFPCQRLGEPAVLLQP
jgi:hypothetical protein